eukprot:g12820.t1
MPGGFQFRFGDLVEVSIGRKQYRDGLKIGFTLSQLGPISASCTARFAPSIPTWGRSFSGTPSDLAPLGDTHTADAICMDGRFPRRKEARR